MPSAVQPALHKPKSRLRLRLGLTPPHPKPSPGKAVTTTVSHPTVPRTRVDASPPRPSPQAQLAVSTTSTQTSTTSRADSRSLFTYDSTSPSDHDHYHDHDRTLEYRHDSRMTANGLTFDTVSYISTSPASVAFDHLVQPAAQSLYPTPPASSHDFDDGSWRDHTAQFEELEVSHDVDGIDRPSMDAYPELRSVIKASDDVFYLSNEKLGQRFAFLQEIGVGNWGNVWLARPRRLRSQYFSRADLTPNQRAITRLGTSAAASGGSGAGGKVALKLVQRSDADACTPARIRALWGEMKIIRTLRQEPHPSIIQFEAFVITPSYAFVIMPLLEREIDVKIPLVRAQPYFRQLASAVGYLHERGITHNDIKPANIMINYSDIPVLVDFGFAHRWNMDRKDAFMSIISWGTPEYLDPLRAQGLVHDERKADVWSLGITFFELLIGRSPFEAQGEQIKEEDRYAVYIERALAGQWLGEWDDIPDDMVHLLQFMLHPKANRRMTAMQAYHHPSLHPAAPTVMVTPHFIREAAAATTWDEPPPLHVALGNAAAEAAVASGNANADKKRRTKKKVINTATTAAPRSTTPALPLGESIKQHTSVPRPKKGEKANGEKETPSPKKGSRLVIKKMRSDDRVNSKVDEEDPTRKSIADSLRHSVVKPAQQLQTQKNANKDKTLISRPSQAGLREAARLAPRALTADKHDSVQTVKSASGIDSNRSSAIDSSSTKENLAPNNQVKTLSHRASNLSTLSTASSGTLGAGAGAGADKEKSKSAARLKAMQSLEGVREAAAAAAVGAKKDKRDVLANITRPAPEPPRPHSLDSAREPTRADKGEQRRSLGLERMLEDLVEVKEDSPKVAKVVETAKYASTKQSEPKAQAFHTLPRVAQSPATSTTTSPQRKRLAKPAVPDARFDDDLESTPLPALVFASSPATGAVSPSAGANGNKPMALEQDNRFSQISSELAPVMFTPSALTSSTPPAASVPKSMTMPVAGTEAKGSAPELHHRKSVEALALDNRLDKLSEWVKTVESIVDEARKALAEGRELPSSLLSLPAPAGMAGLPMPIPAPITLSATNAATEPTTTFTADTKASSDSVEVEKEREFGVTPDKAIPAHLRTSSTQVEPATPPKWMTYAEAEEKVKQANAWMESKGQQAPGSRPASATLMTAAEMKRVSGKKERGSVVNLLKMFHAEKEDDKAQGGVRGPTPEPNMHIPLKPPGPTLRATPSTPMLRSDSSLSGSLGTSSFGKISQTQRIPARKSESNLRAFNTLPSHHVTFSELSHGQGQQQSAFSDDDEDDDEELVGAGAGSGVKSPRRLYERFLDSTPGVVRQGEGWGSLSSGKAMAKPSSMASLRERARMFLNSAPNPYATTNVNGETAPASIGRATANPAVVAVGAGSGRNIVDLAQHEPRRNSRDSKQLLRGDKDKGEMAPSARPATPGAASVLSVAGTAAAAGPAGQKGRGFWKGLKGLGKKGKAGA